MFRNLSFVKWFDHRWQGVHSSWSSYLQDRLKQRYNRDRKNIRYYKHRYENILSFIYQYIFESQKHLPSSSSSVILGMLCFCRGGLFENKEELVRKVEIFFPISLNSLSWSWWAPIDNDGGGTEDFGWLVGMFMLEILAPFKGRSWRKID